MHKIIKTKEGYKSAIKRLNELLNDYKQKEDEDELDLLILLITDYEKKNFPTKNIDVIEAIKATLLDTDFTMKEFIQIVGDHKTANLIFTRKKDFTIEMVRKLHYRLKIPYDILMKEFTVF